MSQEIEKVMFRMEHFPIVLYQSTRTNGKKYWDFPRIEIPPYHPIMLREGINYHDTLEVLDEALEWSVRDLERITDKRGDIKLLLDEIKRDEITGKVIYSPEIILKEGMGLLVENVPIAEHFFVGSRGINPYGPCGDQGISINPKIAVKSFDVPEEVTFTSELMEEYEMTDGEVFFGRKRIACPNGWYRHNLTTINAVFYKNLVSALDNAVVRKKYVNKTPASSK